MSFQYKVLGDLCDFQNGFVFKSKLFKDSGLPIIRITNIQDQIISTDKLVYFNPKNYKQDFEKYKVEPNDLLIAMSGATTGKIGFNNTNKTFYLNQRVGNLKPKQALNKKYLYYFLLSQVEKNLKRALGAAQPNLSTEQIKNLPLPFLPLPIQEKIVAKLDKIFAEIDKAITVAEANINNTEVLFQNYIKNIFLNINSNEKKIKLEEIAEITSSKRIMKHEYVSDGIPFYRTKEIKELANNKNITKKLFIRVKRYEEIKVKFGVPKKGEILVTAIGTIGEIYLINNDNKFYFKDGNIIWIKNISVADPEYLKFSLISFVKNLNEISQGAAYSALPIHKLKSYDIFIPSMEVQKKIIKKIYNMKFKSNKLNEIYLFKIKEFFALKKSILQQAFSDELVKVA